MNNYDSLLGKMCDMKVAKQSQNGLFLNLDDWNQDERILLPNNQVPEGASIGDSIHVFIYKDSEDRVIATTTKPLIELHQIAKLKVKDATNIGAFLDWGLAKDLLLPFKEQTRRVKPGDEILVSLYVDKSDRLCSTMKIYDYLHTESPYQIEDHVTGTVYEKIENFGIFVAVDNQYSALIPNNEICRDITIGEEIHARVKAVREDGKLTLSIKEKAYIQMDKDALDIFERLKENNGFLPYNDKTPSDVIKKEFKISKNAFKRSIGRLYKEKKIQITDKGIEIIN